MSNKNTHILHFSLSPVQSFIGQARRTRDLWAGSFLLSWLTGQAIAVLIQELNKDVANKIVADEIMILPKVENNDLYKAINGANNTPHIATLPNRFQAKVPEGFDANILTNVIQQKWLGLSQAIYDKFVGEHTKEGVDTQEIWLRQIKNFWQVQWVVVKDEKDNALDKRKNWRHHRLTQEPGKHCTTMGDYQEISGHLSPNKQDIFWQSVREDTDYLNLRPNERLCAITFVKRFFVRLDDAVLQKTIGWIPKGDKGKLANFPSTTYMAAVPWLHWLKKSNQDGLLNEYVTKIKEILTKIDFTRLCGEYPTKLSCIKTNREWNNLDGNLFNQTALENWRSTILSDNKNYFINSIITDPDPKIRTSLLGELGKVPNKSSNFYALLQMDGDSLGKLLTNNNTGDVSDALDAFATGVDEVVTRYCGVTIYAGGDDVMALMPLHQVIDCAYELNCAYQTAFSNKNIAKATISAAIIFSHFHNPLTEVLEQSHYQLESVAKEGNNRNSIAMAIMKPGNIACQWVNKWDKNTLLSLENVAKELHNNTLPRGFYYKIGYRYKTILEEMNADIESIMVAELKKYSDQSIESVKESTKHINNICSTNNIEPYRYQLSGLYLAIFLATEDKSRADLC